MLAFRTNLKSTWPTIQAFGSTTSNTCSSQLELKIKKKNTEQRILIKKREMQGTDSFPFCLSFYNTCHSEASMCGYAALHLHGVAGEGAVGGAVAAAPAALPPNKGAPWPKSGGSGFRNGSALPGTSSSLSSWVGPPGGPLL